MTKLALHCQGVPWWVEKFVARSGAGWVKGIGKLMKP
jgi:hypothetical protein